MSKLQSFRAFLNERLTAAAVEIFGAVEQTVVDYQEENDRLRRLLRITPEINRCRIAALEVFGAVEQTVVEYLEENDRLRRLLRITPEIQLCRIGLYVDVLLVR
ncbi:unnamed protein product [Coregonus sp. 'balchen']|nr:unnamed protein product [Coregonus sp. 'balchen']